MRVAPMNSRFLDACRRRPTDVRPVWFMRQAGRYMKQYREVRQHHPILEICKRPDLAAMVTLQPVEVLDVDAAIIFADLLLPVEPMGLKLQFVAGEGPRIDNPVRTSSDIDSLSISNTDDLGYVGEAIQLAVKALAGRVPLIGFVGAPFTMASYIVEGGPSRTFVTTKQMMYRDKALLHRLLDKITEAIITYMNAQIEAGVHVVQLFDTWAGELTPEDYGEFAFPYEQKIFESLHRGPAGLGVPATLYINGCATILEKMAETGANTLSIDWRIDIAEARERVGDRVALQGNLDPCILLGSPETIRERVHEIIDKAGPTGHIMNLGHGILPQTNVDQVRALVDLVHDSRRTP